MVLLKRSACSTTLTLDDRCTVHKARSTLVCPSVRVRSEMCSTPTYLSRNSGLEYCLSISKPVHRQFFISCVKGKAGGKIWIFAIWRVFIAKVGIPYYQFRCRFHVQLDTGRDSSAMYCSLHLSQHKATHHIDIDRRRTNSMKNNS